MYYSVIIPCAGMGKRMGLGYNKLLYPLGDKTVIETTVQVFIQDQRCQQIVLVISPNDEKKMKELFDGMSKIEWTYGGKERQDSVYEGLLKVNQEYVLIHDGARPFISLECIDRLMKTLEEENACLLMVPAKDTMKVIKDGYVVSKPDRSTLWHAQTPQAFKKDVILEVHKKAKEKNMMGTDDASLAEMFNIPVKVVLGDEANIKITTMNDVK